MANALRVAEITSPEDDLIVCSLGLSHRFHDGRHGVIQVWHPAKGIIIPDNAKPILKCLLEGLCHESEHLQSVWSNYHDLKIRVHTSHLRPPVVRRLRQSCELVDFSSRLRSRSSLLALAAL